MESQCSFDLDMRITFSMWRMSLMFWKGLHQSENHSGSYGHFKNIGYFNPWIWHAFSMFCVCSFQHPSLLSVLEIEPKPLMLRMNSTTELHSGPSLVAVFGVSVLMYVGAAHACLCMFTCKWRPKINLRCHSLGANNIYIIYKIHITYNIYYILIIYLYNILYIIL